MESPPADQATLAFFPHATEETKIDEAEKDDSVQVSGPVLECADAEAESNVAAGTSLQVATEPEAAETETETVETTLTEATSADGNLGEEPAHLTAETAGDDIADSESKVVEQPQAIPPTMLEPAATASAEPESPVHVLTPAETETETETETVEAISTQATGEEGNLGEESRTPYAEAAGDDVAESESKVEEQPEATPAAILQLSAAARDTTATAEPESPVHVSTPAEIEAETETVEAISTEATGEEGNPGEKSSIPYAETAGDDTAESESKAEEQPEDTPTTMLQVPATARDTTATAEPESSVQVLTPAEAETVFKSEEEDGNKDLQSGRAGVDAENPVQFTGETATDGAGLRPEAPKDESASEIVEALESKSVQPQTGSCVTTTASDDANETTNASNKVKELASELAAEPEVISQPDVSTPIAEVSTDQDTKAVTEPGSVDQESIPDSSTENVPNEEAKLSESQERAVEVPNKVEEKISEAEAVQEKIDDGSPSDDTSSAPEVAVVPEVVEQTKRRTLQGLLIAEKNREKVPIGDDQPTDSMSASSTMVSQDLDSNNGEEKAPDFPKENIATDNSESVVAATETAEAVEVKDCSTITEDAVKEPVAEDAKSAAEDAKSIAERDLGPICNEEEKQGEAQKTDSTVAVKPSQRHSNNIMSKVKQSFVKVKKVIVGRSPSSKTLTPPPVEVGEIGIKSEQAVV